MKKKKRVLTLSLYEPHEMAVLKEGKHVLFLGNYWDFHSGCCGTEITFEDGVTIDFEHQWNDGIRRPWSMAEMVAKKIGATVETKYRKRPIPC